MRQNEDNSWVDWKTDHLSKVAVRSLEKWQADWMVQQDYRERGREAWVTGRSISTPEVICQKRKMRGGGPVYSP